VPVWHVRLRELRSLTQPAEWYKSWIKN